MHPYEIEGRIKGAISALKGEESPMKVVTVLNEKGGVGKTTMAMTVSSGLAIMGYRVLVIDADPQAHLTISYGLDKQYSLYDLLVRDAEFSDKNIVHSIPPEVYAMPSSQMQTDKGRLFLIPGNKETRLIAQALENNLFAIRNRLAELERANLIDVVLIDTSPTPSNFHALIYLATHHILYPTEVTYLSFDGLVASIQSTTGYSEQKQKSGLEGIKLTGIIPTKFRHNLLEHQEKYASLKKGFGDLVWQPMPMSVVWEEALARRRSIFSYAYDHPAASNAWKIVRKAKEKILDE